MKTLLNKSSLKRGFTLVEILIVLAILAALAAITYKAFGSTPARGKAIANNAALISLQDNVDRFVLEYGSIPTGAWGTGSGGTVMTTAEKQALLECITGVYSGAVSGLATYAQNNPTHTVRLNAVEAASRFTALVVNSSSVPKVIILQYRSENNGLIVNGDHTVSTSYIADASTLTGPQYYDATANTVWSGTGKAAWPFN